MQCAVRLYLHGFSLDLVFAYEGSGEYYDRRRDMLLRAAEAAGADFLIGAKSGIHLVPLESGDDSAKRLLSLYSVFTLAVSDSDTAAGMTERLAAQRIPEFLPHGERRENVKVYADNSSVTAPDSGWRFGTDGGFNMRKKSSPVPWSYPLGGCCLGTLVTDRSFGFTWLSNSRELRVTPWSGDESGGLRGEDIVAEIDGRTYSLSLCAEEVRYRGACAVYSGSLPGHDWMVEICCEAQRLRPLRAAPVSLWQRGCGRARAYVRL